MLVVLWWIGKIFVYYLIAGVATLSMMILTHTIIFWCQHFFELHALSKQEIHLEQSKIDSTAGIKCNSLDENGAALKKLVVAPGFRPETGIKTFDLLLKKPDSWLTIYVIIQDRSSEDTCYPDTVYRLLENRPHAICIIVDRVWCFKHIEHLDSSLITEQGVQIIEQYAKNGLLPFITYQTNRVESSDN